MKVSVSRGGALTVSMLQIFTSIFSKRSPKPYLAKHPLALSSDEQLALIASMNSLGFWSIDLSTDEVWANQQARHILGFGENTQLDRAAFLGAIHREDQGAFLGVIDAALGHREEKEIELRIGADRVVHWVTLKARRCFDSQNRLRRIAGYVVDERQDKRAASELLTLQQKLTHVTRVALLGELSGALAHELQQPLTAILANAQAAQILANRVPVDNAELKDILQEIVSDDKHAGQIISSLRALLIRAETQFQRVTMETLVEDVLILARGTLMERNVQVHTRLEEHIPAVRGNEVELKQVLLNLVLNACDAMILNSARDRKIEIVVLRQDLRIQISVLDCGRGIDTDQMERVFEPFFTTKENGLGLGLAISQSIVAAHGGKLWATNRPDCGTAFHLTLPIEERGIP